MVGSIIDVKTIASRLITLHNCITRDLCKRAYYTFMTPDITGDREREKNVRAQDVLQDNMKLYLAD